MERILILHGLDHDKMGTDAGPHSVTMEQINALLEQAAKECQVSVSFYQNNDCMQVAQMIMDTAQNEFSGIVFNPGAWMETGIELAEALKKSDIPVVEVHMSNICKNSDVHNVIAPHVTGLVTGFGAQVYSVGLKMLTDYLHGNK